MKVTRKPTYSEENIGQGKIRVSYSIQVDGKEYKREITSRNADQARRMARELVTEQVKENYPSNSGLLGNNIENLPGAGLAKRETPEQAKFRAQNPQQDADEQEPESTINNDSPNSLNGLTSQQAREQLSKAARDSAPRRNYHQRSQNQKNHVPWGTTAFGEPLDGSGDKELDEPVPEYLVRPGEKIIKGPNNATIVLGRDRAPSNRNVFSKNIDERDYESGFSNYMCAGAIDIVVGRMAPYPVNKIGAIEDFVVAPSFNTVSPSILQGLPLEGGEHPGFMMDSARIYVSQMTTIDENFKIKQDMDTSWIDGPTMPDPNNTKSDRKKVIPTSGIMLKADKVRLHSRQDLKIVTGGPYEEFNSMGNACGNNGIHLIAENGLDKNGNVMPQHPMVLGNNLVKYLSEVSGLIEDCVQSIDHAMSVQMAFNQVIASNFDLLPLPSGTTVPNPFKTIAGMVTTLEHLVKTRFGSLLQLINNFRTQSGYLSPSGDDQHWILSRYNTVN